MYLMSVYLGVFLTDVAQLTLFACLVYLLHLAYLVHLAGFPRGGTPYNGLYGEAPPKRGTFFRLQVYKRVGISQV